MSRAAPLLPSLLCALLDAHVEIAKITLLCLQATGACDKHVVSFQKYRSSGPCHAASLEPSQGAISPCRDLARQGLALESVQAVTGRIGLITHLVIALNVFVRAAAMTKTEVVDKF